MWLTSSTDQVLTPTAIALGNFDGIHRGHIQVVKPVLASDFHGKAIPTVVSFDPHPREFFSGQSHKLLTPGEERVLQLENLGVQQLVLLPFDHKLAALTPQEFITEILVKRLQVTYISVGKDFHFGRNRKGTTADLKAITTPLGIQVGIASLQNCTGDGYSEQPIRISSSLIRQALREGKIPQANYLLGRPYTLIGKVVVGQKLGRSIGFPTANLQLPENKFLPRQGVYSVQVTLADHFSMPGVMNLGCRPTVDGKSTAIEVYLLDWSGDLYGQTLTVNLKRFLRPEQKFSSLDALKQQIASDCEAVRIES
ncbi:MAG: bifunctional riboflavin kinase/FAD synthetase [Spirulinaceae cyanobacterium]